MNADKRSGAALGDIQDKTPFFQAGGADGIKGRAVVHHMAGFDGQRFTAQSVHAETDLLGDDQQDVLGAACSSGCSSSPSAA